MKLAGARSCMVTSVTSSVCCTALMRICHPLATTGPSLYQRCGSSQLLSSFLTCVYNPAAVSTVASSGRMLSIRRLSTSSVQARVLSSQTQETFPSNASYTRMQSRLRRISVYGIFFLVSSVMWMIAIFPSIVLAGLLARLFDPKRQRPAAALIQVWYDTWFCLH